MTDRRSTLNSAIKGICTPRAKQEITWIDQNMTQANLEEKMSRKKSFRTVLILVITLILMRLLWIGDAAFILDEPFYVYSGLLSSKSGQFMTLGLPGKFGVKYGPLTAWFFHVLILLSKNLMVITFLKTLIVSVLLGISVLWLVRLSDDFSPYYAIPVFLSPYLWHYSRMLWDLTPCLVAMGFVAYLWFLKQNRPWQLFIAMLFSVLATLTHLMSLTIVVAIIAHVIIFRLKWILKYRWYIVLQLFIVLPIALPYYIYVLTTPKNDVPWGGFESVLFPFLGTRFFTTFNFSYFLGEGWQGYPCLPTFCNQLITFLSTLTWFPYPISWFGFGLGCVTVYRGFRGRGEKDFKFHASFVALSIVILHVITCVRADINTHPHYYDGTWAGMLFFFWLGLSYFWNKKWFSRTYIAYTIILFIFLLQIIGKIHFNHGSRSLRYGPTLKNQIQIAKQILGYDATTKIVINAFHPKKFPHAIAIITEFLPPHEGDKKSITGYLLVDYENSDDSNGALVVKEIFSE